MPILSSTHNVSVSYAEHSASIWLQRYSDLDIETKLLEDLERHYGQSKSGRRLRPEMHPLCAAKCSDGRWYRAKIVSHTETTAYVHYIDYGNVEEVTLESVMVLEPRFYEPYQLAVNVSLSVALTGTENEQVKILQLHLMNKALGAVFYNVHKKWVVDLTENGEKLSDKLRTLNLVEEEQAAASESLSETQGTSTSNGKFNVCVSHVDSPSQFWLQRADEIACLNERQEQLQLEISDFPMMEDIPEEGTLCVAVYSIDNLWYRAEVLDADEDITTVRFIDYGNTDVIDNKTRNIRQIPDSWKHVERFALKCRLDVVPVDMEDWNESICERFENLATSTDTIQAAVLADNSTPKRVELFVNDKSVSETLVEEKHAIIINTEQEPVDEIIDLELDPHSAFVSHINSPNEFWIQEEKLVADLEVMADRFIVADMFPKVNDVKEGSLYVAKYPEDEKWYRARVVSHDDNGTRVIYVDYGNSAVSTDIRAIPEDLATIPPLSRKCCLELPPRIREWSERTREEFIKLSADGATTFLLDVLREQETSLVKLTLDGQNVADILADICCEQDLPLVIEERLPPLGEENSPNVVVSHINGPGEFWIQAESSINELEVMSDRLRDAESFVTLNSFDIGTICAAKYPEDGHWYRAKIIARCGTGSEVLYMDYGNSAITMELRALPEDIANIPMLSKRCALEKPSYVTAWSEAACIKFKELAAEGATMFQYETVDENDPTMRVRLSLNGTSIVDLLSDECENISEIGFDVPEKPKITSDTEGRQETVFHGNYRPDKEIPDLDEQVQRESILFDQTRMLESGIDNETLDNNSSSNFNANEECRYVGRPEKYYIFNSRIAEKADENAENFETATTGSTGLEDDQVSADTSNATRYVEQNKSQVVTELTVDQIVESMMRDSNARNATETRMIDDTDPLKTQFQCVAQTDISKQEELLARMRSIDINGPAKDTQILEFMDRDITSNSSTLRKHLTEDPGRQKAHEVTNESELENSTCQNADPTRIKKKEARSEVVLDTNEFFKLGSTTRNEIISAITNKGSPLEIQSRSTSVSHDSNPSESTSMVKTTESSIGSVIKTDPADQRLVDG